MFTAAVTLLHTGTEVTHGYRGRGVATHGHRQRLHMGMAAEILCNAAVTLLHTGTEVTHGQRLRRCYTLTQRLHMGTEAETVFTATET